MATTTTRRRKKSPEEEAPKNQATDPGESRESLESATIEPFWFDPYQIHESGRKILNHLAERFPPEKVKQRSGGGGKMLDYISIDTALDRADEVMGLEWSWEIAASTLTPTQITDRNGNMQWLGVVVGHVLFGQTKRGGVGAALNPDPDMAFKTALAEAQKKALGAYGVGRYLWREEERELLAAQRQLDQLDLDALKKAVYQLALSKGLTDHTPNGVAKLFGIGLDELQDADKLREILRRG